MPFTVGLLLFFFFLPSLNLSQNMKEFTVELERLDSKAWHSSEGIAHYNASSDRVVQEQLVRRNTVYIFS